MQKQSTPRRVKVTNERGIYYRQTSRGRRYEIYYADSDGKQRWKVIPGFDNLGEARQARAAIVDKLGRGERVAPEKRTLAEAAEEWLEAQNGRLRPRTKAGYRSSLENHVLPLLGRRRLTDITVEDVLTLMARMRAAGKSEWTVQSALKPLSRILGHAARHHRIPANPVRQLEREEKPKPAATERAKRILEEAEIERLLAAAPARYRTLLTTAVFTGLRQGELLGLTWADVDFEAAVIRVRYQLDRQGNRVEPKTPQAKRDVELMPALVKRLREHKLASPFSQPGDFVFASETGGPLYYRNVSKRGLEKAVENGNLAAPKPRWHDLRHTATSLLIAEGLNVVYVSRQMGHKDAGFTLRVYGHLFDRAAHAQRANAALEARYGAMV